MDSKEREYLQKIKDRDGELALLSAALVKQEGQIIAIKRAVARWREKAGVDPPAAETTLVGAERKKRRVYDGDWKDEWFYLESLVIPGVERSVELAHVAWAWVQENLDIEKVERIYFSHRYGWVVVLRGEWDVDSVENILAIMPAK